MDIKDKEINSENEDLNEQDKYADIVEPESDIKIEGSYLIR